MFCVVGRSLSVALLAALAIAGRAEAADLAGYVNPFNGTQPGAPDFGTGGGAGNTNPGPTVPLGMAQWGPDTSPSSANAGGGYAYGDAKIRGFSLRRLSGAGCANEGDVPFLPTPAAPASSPVDPLSTDFRDSLLPSFTHADEAATPGFYRVGLGSGVDAALTATRRTGVGRFTFPAAPLASVLVNATGSRTGNSAGSVSIDPAAREVSGAATSGAFCILPNSYRIYFVARFSRPFASYGTWTRQSLAPGSTAAQDSATGPPFVQSGRGATAQTGAYVSFDTSSDPAVEVRVGISFVSVEGARANLEAESADRSFDAVRAGAPRTWNRMLGRVAVAGGRVEDRRTFYSMLYHALIHPSTFSDVDGRYRGFDDKVHSADGYTQYADFSGWDVYRSQIPLLALVAPRQASDLVRSMLADQRESGWLPKWSLANSHSNVMTGDPAPPAIAHVWALGARRFDLRAALAAAVKGATETGTSTNAGYVERQGLEDYLRLGYVPHEKNGNLVTASGLDSWRHEVLGPDPTNTDLAWGSAATTLEYATADFAVARLAAAAGDRDTCRTFLRRAGNWRNVFDGSIGYARPRWATGPFVAPYDPNTNDPLSSQGFVEGDGAQYTWMVPHDPAGLFDALGGRDAAQRRLDGFFAELNAGPSSPHAFLGNEPNSNAPWLYDWIGRPYRTQDIMRRAILTMFNASPTGYPGNDDLGQMSAWYVFGALGLYPAVPGADVLALGSPLFPRATLHLAGGDVRIIARGAARDAPYVRRLALNGRQHRRPWLRLADVARGGKLTFALASTPDPRWGSAPTAAPPSFGPKSTGACRG